MNGNKKIFSNLIWRFMGSASSQIMVFIVQIVLARMLEPEMFGTVASVKVFTAILLVFVDSGLANSLIQKKDPDDLDFSSVFYFNVAFCLVLYTLLYIAAPFIAGFYEDAQLTAIIRVLGLTVIISGVQNVQQAYVSKTLQFKRFFFATLGGTIVSAAIGITMVYRGFGVWSLVMQQLSNVAANTLILWLTVDWKPKWLFSLTRLKTLLSYGWKLLASTLLDTVYRNLRTLIIGKKYSEEDLAFYDRGELFPQVIVANINASVDSVLLPTMSSEQNHTDRVRDMARRAISTSSYVMWPLMMGLAACAEPIVRLLLTDKWLPCVPYLRIFCLTYAFQPILTANLSAIKALGRSDLYLKMEVWRKIVGIAIIGVTMWYGVMVIALGNILANFLFQIISAYPNRKLLGYTYAQQLADILPSALLSLFMGALVLCVSFLNLPDILLLVLQVALGAAIYIGASKLLHFENFDYVLNAVKSLVRK